MLKDLTPSNAFYCCEWSEPPHDITNKMTVPQISLGIHQVWSEFSLYAKREAKDQSFLHADSEDSDQTGWMPRLTWVFAGRTCHFVGFAVSRFKYCWNPCRELCDSIPENIYKMVKANSWQGYWVGDEWDWVKVTTDINNNNSCYAKLLWYLLSIRQKCNDNAAFAPLRARVLTKSGNGVRNGHIQRKKNYVELAKW